MSLTLAESMAMAVIRGDRSAAYALADLLREETEGQGTLEAKAHTIGHGGPAAQSYDVYSWPEFRAFAKRLGFAYDLRTEDVVIRMHLDGPVVIEHNYQGSDMTRRNPPVTEVPS